jgi:hypothetical protein
MLRIARFGGIISNCSSYAVPPGGAVQQINLTCRVPGQLTSRAGMAQVQYDKEMRSAPEKLVTQLFPTPGGVGRGDKLILIEEDGTVHLTQSVS